MKMHKIIALAALVSIIPMNITAKDVQHSAFGYPVVKMPGTYTDVDVASLFNIATSEMTSRQEKQIETIKASITEMENQFKNLLERKVQPLKNLATGGNKIFKRNDQSFEQLYASYDDLHNAKSLLELALANLKSLPQSLSETEKISFNGETIKYPNIINKEAFDQLVENLNVKLQQIYGDLSQLGFNIETTEGAHEYISFNELDSYRAKTWFTVEMQEEMTANAERMRAGITKSERKLDQTFSLKIRNEISNFIKIWADDRKFQIKEFNENGFKDELANLERFFFMRSALRIMYKIPIGTYCIDYQKRAFNLEVLRKDVNMYRLMDGVCRNTKDLKQTKDNLINALAILEMRAKTQPPQNDVEARELGSQIAAIFTGDGGIMERVLGARSVLTGTMPLVRSNIAVLRLLLIDVEEELKIQEFGGDLKVKLAHKARFGSKEDQEIYEPVKKELIAIINGTSRITYSTDSVEQTLFGVITSLTNMQSAITQSNTILEKVNRLANLAGRGSDAFTPDTDF